MSVVRLLEALLELRVEARRLEKLVEPVRGEDVEVTAQPLRAERADHLVDKPRFEARLAAERMRCRRHSLIYTLGTPSCITGHASGHAGGRFCGLSLWNNLCRCPSRGRGPCACPRARGPRAPRGPRNERKVESPAKLRDTRTAREV